MADNSLIGTPFSSTATKALLLGAGELGKEVAIELQRFGVEVIAVDRYRLAPAMQVAHRSYVTDMQDPGALRAIVRRQRPNLIVPEIEAIATEVLVELEDEFPEDLRVVPTARAASLTMNREGIRKLAAEELGLPTSVYRFVDSVAELREAAEAVGLPCVVKPVMSSSGKGQSVLHSLEEVSEVWRKAQREARGGDSKTRRCIVESFIEFDQEITLLTVRHREGTTFLDPIHHRQEDGDYAESWQEAADSAQLTPEVIQRAQDMAGEITEALGGWGLFGVELFIRGADVIFSEVSPRPHDTGLVTLVSGDLSEFALHVRAIMGLPAPLPQRFPGAAASFPIKVRGNGVPQFGGVAEALAVDPSVQVRLFGKPSVDGERRVAVVLARSQTSTQARALAREAAERITVTLAPRDDA